MTNPLCADKFVGQLLNIARLAPKEHNFKARIVIEMGMQRRDDNFMMFVLQVGQFFGEKPRVMVIDQSHGCHDWSSRGHDCSPHKPVPDQVAEGLGSVVVAFSRDEIVKPIE
ncbi:MAG TPA: hypothetical protein VEI54_00445 [Candidatus Limnocylindrales bacterium]|nr:hypothetical protein [Candidatus Limnocylindrales bacterium]